MFIETKVLIIGGGITGAGLVRDLALRGIDCLLIEKRDINAGASGGNHGLLHSGARYVGSDGEAARECEEEGVILRRMAPQCIENTGGLFVAVAGDDENYVANFPTMCERNQISCIELDLQQAAEMEPCLSKKLIAAYQVRDGAIDPFMLSLDNLAQAKSLGCRVMTNTQVTGFDIKSGKIDKIQAQNQVSGQKVEIKAELIINAAGAWAGMVAQLAGAEINILYSMGSLLVTQDRLAKKVINRLRKPADGDILVPGGTVSILGTTSISLKSPDDCRPTAREVDQMIAGARDMIPVLESTRYIRAYAGVRPLVISGQGGDGRSISRGFSLIDHAQDNIENFISITGGKLTTYRLMAEKAADLACTKLGISASCQTATTLLPASVQGRWTDPAAAPKSWIEQKKDDDVILCECEMVSKGVVNEIINETGRVPGYSMLRTIGLRSRVGKGPCQGGFCGLRITSHLYDEEYVQGTQGVQELKRFIEGRWQGFSPVLWAWPQAQAELQEALYCGALDLELEMQKDNE